jgi:hypothetical protein
MITRDMIIAADARHKEQGLALASCTPHRAAHYLMRYDPAFKACDYTLLVSEIYSWQRIAA